MESLTELRVRYAETDAMGIVHHAAYIPWLEAGRTELLRQAGFPYTGWEARGVFMSVAEVHLTYRAPARFDELVQVRTWIQAANRRKVVFAYTVSREGLRLAQGHSVHLVTGPEGRVRTLPDDLRTLVEGWVRQDHGAGEEGPQGVEEGAP
jgi:acyl-CoA thioester hydrolase